MCCGWSIRDVATSALVFAIACGIFGTWLLLVSLLALKEDLEKILDFFQADSAIVFFLPRMLAIGTRSVWRRFKPPHGLTVQRESLHSALEESLVHRPERSKTLGRRGEQT